MGEAQIRRTMALLDLVAAHRTFAGEVVRGFQEVMSTLEAASEQAEAARLELASTPVPVLAEAMRLRAARACNPDPRTDS